MKSNFEACLAEVLKHEGGWADHPKDPGGATMKGVTIGTYSTWLGRQATKEELRNIPEDHLHQIYKAWYWDKVKGDELPRGVDLCLFDYAVNSGPKRAVVATQDTLRVNPDGALGPKTLWAIQKADAATLVGEVCQRRLAFLQSLPIWNTFGAGWGRRVKEVETMARKMCATS
jgi:lysozyme family protein